MICLCFWAGLSAAKAQTVDLLIVSPLDSIGRTVRFSTDFSSGALSRVELIDAQKMAVARGDTVWHLSYNVYSPMDPLNPIDTTLEPSGRWFYFRMEGVKNKHIYLNFFQTDPVRPMYSYDGKHFERLEAGSAERRKVSKRFTRDTVYLAYFTPYTYDFLQERIHDWQAGGNVLALDTIGYSVRGKPLQLLTITDPSVPEAQKLRIYIHGRIHTSETPGSWHLDGMIEALQANTPQAAAYRRQMVFYVLPFTNPDGVIEGLSRSNVLGVNLEINYDRPDSLTMPEVRAIKAKLSELTAERPLDMVLNMHSQVASMLTYWVHTVKGTSALYFRQQLLLANLSMFQVPAFAKSNLSFADGGSRYVEGWLWNQVREQTIAITYETPYTYYALNPHEDWVSIENLREIGGQLMDAVGDYYGLSVPGRYILQPENVNKKHWTMEASDDKVFMGEGYYQPRRARARLSYHADYLPAGNYQVFRWAVGDAVEISPEGSNEWVWVENIRQKADGKFSYTVEADGQPQNAILLLPL